MSVVPVISVVGKSNVGKTTFLEKLIPELVRRGYRVGTLKHDVHGFELDTPGKDTWRHAQAGSRAVVISGPTKVAVLLAGDREATLDEAVSLIEGEVDIVITEGYKRQRKPKIEVSRAAKGGDLLCTADELICLVTDSVHDLAVPQFGLDDAAGVADLLEQRWLRGAGALRASLIVDGKPIDVDAVAAQALAEALQSLVGQLAAGADAREVVLRLRRS